MSGQGMMKATLNPLTQGNSRDEWVTRNSVWTDPTTEKSYIRIEALPSEIKEYMECFGDESGKIDASHLVQAGLQFKASQQQSKMLQKILWTVICLMLVFVGCGAGLTYAVVELSKEVKVDQEGLLHVAGPEGGLSAVSAKTEHPDMAVKDGALVDRGSNQPMITQSESEMKSVHTMTSAWPNEMFQNLNHINLAINMEEDGMPFEAFLQVQSFFRVPSDLSANGTLVHLKTDLGEVTVIDENLYMDEDLKAALLNLGFPLDQIDPETGRKLLEVREVHGRQLHVFAVLAAVTTVVVSAYVLGVYSIGWCVWNCWRLDENPRFFG